MFKNYANENTPVPKTFWKNLTDEQRVNAINEVIKNTVHSFVATALLVVLGIIAAIAAGHFVEDSFLTLLLSYCPGGIYEVAVIAIAFDLNPNFVAFHHIIRLLMILFTIPVILKLIDRKRSSNP